jgi:hypothetical protein
VSDAAASSPSLSGAIETGDAGQLADLLTGALREEVLRKFDHVMRLKPSEHGPVPEARDYVCASGRRGTRGLRGGGAACS